MERERCECRFKKEKNGSENGQKRQISVSDCVLKRVRLEENVRNTHTSCSLLSCPLVQTWKLADISDGLFCREKIEKEFKIKT